MNRIRVVGLAGVFLLAGCAAASAPTPSSPSPAAGDGSTASSSPFVTPLATPAIRTTNGSDLLVLRRDGGPQGRGYAVGDGVSMAELSSLPVGVASSDWRSLYTVASSGAQTTVTAIDPNDGTPVRTFEVAGTWQLPTIGVAHVPAGLSGDGRILVLVEPPVQGSVAASGSTTATTATRSATTATTRFAVVTTDGSAAPRVVTMPGSLEYDAIAPAGTTLFVLQHVAGADPSHYVVRSADLASGRLVEGTIVDKRNAGEAMGGYAVAQVAGDSGWVYTVYRGRDGPFIHALDTADSIAFCMDLPGPKDEDEATAAAWGMSLAPSGDTLYATNGALGTVAQVDLGSFEVSRTSTLARLGLVEPAKFGSGVPGTAGQAALGPGGASLYVVGDRGIAIVRTSDLASTGRIGADRSYRAVAVGSGGTLYAVDATGTVSRIDPATGTVLASSSGGSFSGIVAVVPHD